MPKEYGANGRHNMRRDETGWDGMGRDGKTTCGSTHRGSAVMCGVLHPLVYAVFVSKQTYWIKYIIGLRWGFGLWLGSAYPLPGIFRDNIALFA